MIIKQFVSVVTALALLAVSGLVSAQNNQPELHRASTELGVDVARSLPYPVLIEDVNRQDSIIRIDGLWYRWAADRFPELAASAGQDASKSVSLSELRQGLEVIVLTDGTAADDDHQPYILGMWKQR